MTQTNTLPCPRLLIAGVSSGVGKTTFTVGLCRALMRRGLRVAVFKCGPDYLDPGYHRIASGLTVHNLDSWLMGPEAVRSTFARHASRVDVSLIEGVMGLFDGASPTSLSGSSAEIAQILEAPIALVCDASGMARSIAALAHGFATFAPGVSLSALIANHVGSMGHLELLRRACVSVPVLGGMIRNPARAFPERHLGLHAAHELDLEPSIEAWATQVEAQCDVAGLLAIANAAPAWQFAEVATSQAVARCRIAIADDGAFHFYYDANLRMLEQAGAELVRFSPVHDTTLPNVDGLYIGGGYPELHAAALAANRSMLDSIRAFAKSGKPIYAECGGLMYLSNSIITLQGAEHEMVGLLQGSAAMRDKLQALGYVEVETRDVSPLGPVGTRFRGHQFRYSQFETHEPPSRYAVHTHRNGHDAVEGYGAANVLASYVHAHWASNPSIPQAFVDSCIRAR